MMQFGGTIYDLSQAEAHNPAAAIENAEAVTAAVINIIKKNKETNDGRAA